MAHATALLCVASIAGSASLASAGFLAQSRTQYSTEHTGSAFTVFFEYAPTGESTGSLSVTLDNITPDDVGGFLTGIVFDIQSSDPDATASLISTTNGAFVDIAGSAAQPFGDHFDAGAAVGGNWQGGGNPTVGIPAGGSATFGFDVFASDAGMLTDTSFSTGGLNPHTFIARFRGGTESDKVPANPSPGGAALLAIGGFVASRRRR